MTFFLQQQQSQETTGPDSEVPSPFYPAKLKVQIDAFKNMHIRLENHQPLRIRHLILQELISKLKPDF